MRSGELARAAGVGVQTLRYYERRGLLPAPRRTPAGYREYDDGAVALLRAVKAAQRLGFTLDEVADLLDTRRRHPPPDLQERARAKLAEVEERLADLARVREGLLEVVRARCASLTHCTCAAPPVAGAPGGRDGPRQPRTAWAT